MQSKNSVIAGLIVGNAGQSENGPARIVRVTGHPNAGLFAHGNDRVQKIFEMFQQAEFVDVLIQRHHMFQIRQALGLPSGQGESVGLFRRAAYNVHGGHVPQLFFVKIKTVGPIFGNRARKIRAQPVQHRHKIVDNDFDTVFRQIADGDPVVFNVQIPGWQAEFDVLVHIDALNDFAFQSGGMYLFNVSPNLLFVPDLPGRLVIQQSHNAAHTGNLLDLFECDRVAVISIPAKCHFHCAFLLSSV